MMGWNPKVFVSGSVEAGVIRLYVATAVTSARVEKNRRDLWKLGPCATVTA